MSEINNKNITRWIDLSVLPKYKKGKVNCIDWNASIGIPIPFIYNTISGNIIITKVIENSNDLWVHVDGYTFCDDYKICKHSFRNAYFGQLLTEKIITSASWLIQYFDDPLDAQRYSKRSAKRVNVHCPFCGHKKNMKIDDLFTYGFACPNCSDSFSYPSKFIRSLLTQLNINFIQEVTRKNIGFEWVGNYRYDFYFRINDRRIFLESDGHFHYGDYFETYEQCHERDLIKDQLAMEHGIEVIRIDCKYPKNNRFEYIKNNIINSELKNIFNFETLNINWNACDKHARSSLFVEACDLWNCGKYTITDIANLLNLKPCTIATYLKDGDTLGLCSYDVVEAKIKGLQNGWNKIKQEKSKPILLLKNNVPISVFPSAMELQRQSLKLYGKTFQNSAIRQVCNGIYKQAYGYTMQDISREEYEQLLPRFAPTVQNECKNCRR